MARQREKRVDIWKQLLDLHEKFKGDDVILGQEALGFPRKTDAARENMYVNHLSQRMNMSRKSDGSSRAEKPKVFTNYEDLIGDRSSFIHKAKENCVVDKIIQKFPSETGELRVPFLMFLHYLDSDSYDVIEVKDVENLFEKYGFEYDIRKMINVKEGDRFSKDDIITSPLCFDEFGNYGFGKNYTFLFQVSDDTIEDGIKINEEIADDKDSDKYFGSKEVYLVKVPLNDNAIFINTYGDANNWKCFPEIGEKIIRNQVCTQRTVVNSQILFDLKSSNTRRNLPGDRPSFISGTVVDIDIYCNKKREELPDTLFYKQINRYYDMLLDYNKQIVDYTQELIDSGCNVTQKLRVINKDARDYIDPNVHYKDENDRIFSNMVFYFLVKKDLGIAKGQKITGRHGNKGVVAKKVPKHLMPHLETGKVVDIVLDGLGPVNRLNVMQLFEQTITFIGNRNIEYFKDKPIEIKEKISFSFIETLNPEEGRVVRENYEKTCLTDEAKEEYFRIIEKYGFYIHVPPYWSDTNLYDAILKCYDMFSWVQPYKVFFYEEETKRWVKMMTDQIVGEMYFIKLKQTSKKGLSARSTGPVNRRGVPDKTDSAKKFQVPYSNIPVRRGKQEVENDLISVDPEKTAIEQLAYRCSPVAIRDLATRLTENYMGIDTFEPTKDMTNVNVQALSLYMLMMGFEMRFEYDELDFSDTSGIKRHTYKNQEYYCTTDTMKRIVAKDIAEGRFREKRPGAIYFGPEIGVDNFLEELTCSIKENIMEYL